MEVAGEKAREMMRFEETELRLGLPGGEVVVVGSCVRKRGFSETVDLQLNLSSSSSSSTAANKEPPPCAAAAGKLLDATPPPGNKMEKSLAQAQTAVPDPAKPPAKAQVVGWPPVRSFRKNMVQTPSSVRKSSTNSNGNSNSKEKDVWAETEVAAGSFVKVSMDGAPYLRKVDLKMYASYKQLSDALANMFNSFSNSNNEAAGVGGGMKDFMNDNNTNCEDFAPTYEDKDGDWMLVGDVPWELFVVSCKRLRIMKGKDAINGLAPRGMEKRKNRA